MQKYVIHEGKKLRYGFTTGSSAAAATKAACMLLMNAPLKKTVAITLPTNEILHIPIYTAKKEKELAIVTVIKDGGDDADVTSGLEIGARVSFSEERGIHIKGGEGVGVATKKGLPIGVGEPAINPVPQVMIKQSVIEVIDILKQGIEVEIFVPKGEEIAKRTLNYKLGIHGGISILGSTGIVKPMSEEAYKDSLSIELKAMYQQQDTDTFVFTFGNYGRKFATNNLGLVDENIIIISNFVGFMLEKACEFGIKKILFVGNIGKIVKVAGGIFHTHSRVSDARLEIMAANAIKAGEKLDVIQKILKANTTEEAVEMLNRKDTFDIMAQEIREKCETHVRRSGYELEVAALIYSSEQGELARTDNFYVGNHTNA
ncbi:MULTISPECIES: cobalt-precorrin-5B (C(1))-methyltransferase CbiD [Sulfurospirillum]|uniref:Cobalt-precorrin-5B C(1)-methyltransferase n=3 Tax=Sulfurospirillum TaxID=57665 RepID=A0A1Y0HMI5_9BACT|nr:MULTISPECIES: cobalt-precorrin-5B (C(1))-methyltransferase CbiD [Sulfurospirillum]AHJ12816.1 cobalt-precorrin-6 synthase, anaerobic CbiD [Sulfurospirillum multivorans DSM 12446]ARU48776.1 cobalt-precorrin-6 synthase, anaerobic CbiD [Sulfurospirillum diekertiae]ASC93598.1 cobalt-precorrin-6 synthase, anaerobic CbiD [Sulfurospirillum diekertiae]ATB69642.1 cobalt-precorrin-6 synthase, anaerobic CbiD [Sulfurospirillum diekertiae]QEH06311.1 cobalt-precorrin-6 synthase, anaerobic CbiD [Sulfurospi